MAKQKINYSEGEAGGKITFESPVANMQGGWLGLIINEIERHSQALLQEGDGVFFKAHLVFLKIVHELPQNKREDADKPRDILYENHKKRLEERYKAERMDHELTDTEKAQIRAEVEIETLGAVTDYCQRYIGIEEELTVDLVGFRE